LKGNSKEFPFKKIPEQVGLAQGRDISRGTTLIATLSFMLPLITESINPCPYYGGHPSVPTNLFKTPAPECICISVSICSHHPQTLWRQSNVLLLSEDIFLSFVAFMTIW